MVMTIRYMSLQVSLRFFLAIQVDWTPDLHRRFIQAVEQLGIDQAIPSKILELMKADGLTRHNIASHLQVCIFCFINSIFFHEKINIFLIMTLDSRARFLA